MRGNIWGKVDQEEHPDLGTEHSQHPEDEVEDGDHKQQDQPEPEDDVDLVIDHIDWEDTQPIKSKNNCKHLVMKYFVLLLNASGHTKVVKSAFCHFWENFNHWIITLFIIQ